MNNMKELVDLTDHNDFDRYVRERGWIYDNGCLFENEHWDSYAGTDRFRRYLLLRQSPGRVILVVRGEQLGLVRAWSGTVTTSLDVADMLSQFKDQNDHI